ncbi:MAG TPA: class I SAM-dependent methyltransferase, partial [Streptosporangiaceae bacterium]|nr:class I SAM-dependent methyltransferase [Streptosporangiaceae bacterium]
MTRAQLDKRPTDVAAMFDAVADRYDLLNDVLSLGQDRWWRSIVARLVAAKADDLVLDIAAGTGTSSRAFTKAGARCVACDFSLGMLRAGARKPGGRVTFAAGDALALPFAEQTFDV